MRLYFSKYNGKLKFAVEATSNTECSAAINQFLKHMGLDAIRGHNNLNRSNKVFDIDKNKRFYS